MSHDYSTGLSQKRKSRKKGIRVEREGKYERKGRKDRKILWMFIREGTIFSRFRHYRCRAHRGGYKGGRLENDKRDKPIATNKGN